MKRAPEGKSRLRLERPDRQDVVRAIALDTIEAAVGSPRVQRVLVVTADQPLVAMLSAFDRVGVVHDTAKSLNSAINLGLAASSMAEPRAVLLGDLPALKSSELSSALTLAAHHELTFVPDTDGTGTVLATAGPGIRLVPRFGEASAAAHRRDGFVGLHLPANSGLRRDLDVLSHLPALRRNMLGVRTSVLLG